MSAPGDVTSLLLAYREGDREAYDRLLPLVYDDLRRIARGHLRRQRSGHTLGTTGIVHEAYLKLVDPKSATYQDRNHFLAVAARAMRQVIISYARRHSAGKRGGGERALPLEERDIPVEGQADTILAVDQALARLEEVEPRLARVVECRFFAGLDEQETAEALGVSARTVQRDWMRARAWLKEELSRGSS